MNIHQQRHLAITAGLMLSLGLAPNESTQVQRYTEGFQNGRVLALNSESLGMFGGQTSPLDRGLAVNDSLFEGANPHEFLSNYAVRYQDPLMADLMALQELLAPLVPSNGSQLVEYAVYHFADAFKAMDNSQDLKRGIGADFPTVQNPTKYMARQRIPNLGLAIEVDEDEERLDADWQQRKVAFLRGIIDRTLLRQTLGLAAAAAITADKTWSTGTPDPDLDILNEILVAPLPPTGVIYGPTAWSKRLQAYSTQLTPGGFAGQTRNADMLAGHLSVGDVKVVKNRVSTGGITTAAIVGQYVLQFISGQNLGRDDFSNMKTFSAPTKTGAPYASYVRQIGDKRWRIAVECYRLPAITSAVGLTISNIS